MRLEIRLDFVPAKCGLVYLSLAHFIARIDDFYERCFGGGEHELNKYRRLSHIIGGIDGRIILPLAVMDDRLHWKPGKGRIPLRTQQGVPQSSYISVSFCIPMADSEKAIASSRNSFSSFSRWISFSCARTCFLALSLPGSALMLPQGSDCPQIQRSQLHLPGVHPYSVFLGIPSSQAACACPISQASFTSCTLYSELYCLPVPMLIPLPLLAF